MKNDTTKNGKKPAKQPEFVAVSDEYYSRIEHYKSGERATVWIKLYLDLLDNVDFCQMPDSKKFHWIGLMMLAAKLNNRLPNNPKFLSQRLFASDDVDVDFFLSKGFLFPLKR